MIILCAFVHTGDHVDITYSYKIHYQLLNLLYLLFTLFLIDRLCCCANDDYPLSKANVELHSVMYSTTKPSYEGGQVDGWAYNHGSHPVSYHDHKLSLTLTN